MKRALISVAVFSIVGLVLLALFARSITRSVEGAWRDMP